MNTVKLILGTIISFSLLLVGCNHDVSTSEPGNQGDTTQVDITDIIALNTDALGGQAALDGVRDMVKKSIIEQGEHRSTAIFTTSRKGRMRIDIFNGSERVFAESFDGRRGHKWNPKEGQSEASQLGTIALSHTPQLPNHVFRLKDMAANGHQLVFLEEQEIDGVNYYVLQLTLSDGFENFLFVDAESGLVKRIRNKRALHVDIDDDEKTIETLVYDFRRVGDIVHSYGAHEVDTSTGEILVKISVESLAVNKGAPTGFYADLVNMIPVP